MSKQYFETIRCFDFEAFHLDYHQKRMAKTVGLNFDLNEYIYAPTAALLKCKLIYDESGIVDVAYTPYTKRKIQSFKLLNNDALEYTKKALDRGALDALFAQRGECDEVIIIKNGLVTDTSIANIAVFDGNTWVTPKSPLLHGVTKERLIKEGQIFEKDITVTMLQEAKKIALLNAMIDMDVLEDYSLSL